MSPKTLLPQSLSGNRKTPALAGRNGEFEKRFGWVPGGEILDLAVSRMLERGTDEEEAVRWLSGMIEGIGRFRAGFREKHGVDLSFTDEARERLVVLAAPDGNAEALCWRLFANYPLGLQLLLEKTGRHEFVLDLEAVNSPDRSLDLIIKENFNADG